MENSHKIQTEKQVQNGYIEHLEDDWGFETHAFGVGGLDINELNEETARYVVEYKNWGNRRAFQEFLKTQTECMRKTTGLKTFKWLTKHDLPKISYNIEPSGNLMEESDQVMG